MSTAIVMSGGGAKGCIQLGALKYFEEQGLKVDSYYGTSVGALNSCGMSMVGYEGLEDIWFNIKGKSDILKFKWWTLGPIFGDGIHSTAPLRKKLDKITHNNPSVAAKVCKINIETGSIEYGKAGDPDFAESCEQSAAIPLAMNVVNKFVDGGVREISPLSEAIKDGHTDIIVLLAAPWQKNPEKWKMPKAVWNKPWTWFNLFLGFKIGMRAVDILAHEAFVNDLKVCMAKNHVPGMKKVRLRIYAPKKEVIDTLDFNPQKIRIGHALGYQTAKDGPIKEVE